MNVERPSPIIEKIRYYVKVNPAAGTSFCDQLCEFGKLLDYIDQLEAQQKPFAQSCAEAKAREQPDRLAGHLGRFRIARGLLRDEPSKFSVILSACIIVDTQYNFQRDTIEYTAYCPWFAKINEGELIPEYLFELSSIGGGPDVISDCDCRKTP